MVEILFRFGYDYAGQTKKSDKVRDGHEAVYDIGENPDGLEFKISTGSNENSEDDAVRYDAFNAEQILAGTFAVIVPAENCREGE